MASLAPAMAPAGPAGPPLAHLWEGTQSLRGMGEPRGGNELLFWIVWATEPLSLQFCAHSLQHPLDRTLWKQHGGRSYGHTRNTVQLRKRAGSFPSTTLGRS